LVDRVNNHSSLPTTTTKLHSFPDPFIKPTSELIKKANPKFRNAKSAIRL